MSAPSSAVSTTAQRRHGYFNLKRTYIPIIDKWLMENNLDYAIFYPSFLNWAHRTVARSTNSNVTMTEGEKMAMVNIYEYNLCDEAPSKYVEALEYYRRERWGGHDRLARGLVKNFGSDDEILHAEDALLAVLIEKHRRDHPEQWDGDRGLMMPPPKIRRATVQAQHDDDQERTMMAEGKLRVESSGVEDHGDTAMEAGDKGEEGDDDEVKMTMDSDDDYNPPEPVTPWWD
ncbi:MAG: hypothetical protein M1836_000841 [Candelina mexicana]|nr:MAG: hypothetical protein M1836_000841 [Candelina mexicana]